MRYLNGSSSSPGGAAGAAVASILALLLAATPLLALDPTPSPAAPHDDLRSARPGPGDTLSVAPTELRLSFTGPVNARLATVALAGPAGPVAVGEPTQPDDSARILVVAIEGPLGAGEYTVRWRIIGSDGHPVEGDYRFTILDGAAGLRPQLEDPGQAGQDTTGIGEGASADADSGPAGSRGADFDSGSTAYVLIRWLGLAALVALIGAAAFRGAVLPLARRRGRPHPLPRVLDDRAAGVGLAAAVVLAGAALARLGAQAVVVTSSTGLPDYTAVRTLLTGTVWGAGWLLQAAGILLALSAFALARRAPPAARLLEPVAAVALAVAAALSGHAAAAARPFAWPVLVDALHVLAAGGWVGSLLVLLVVGIGVARRTGRPDTLVDVVQAFSLTALGFAGILVLTGVLSATLHLPSWSALTESGYGRVLLIKVAVILPLFATGAYNFRKVRPRLPSTGGATVLRRTAAAELALALLVLLATAVLVATPPPQGDHADRSAMQAVETP